MILVQIARSNQGNSRKARNQRDIWYKSLGSLLWSIENKQYIWKQVEMNVKRLKRKQSRIEMNNRKKKFARVAAKRRDTEGDEMIIINV